MDNSMEAPNKHLQEKPPLEAEKPIPLWVEHCCSLLGVFISMGIISLISVYYHMYILIPSFASSAVMLFTSYNNPLAQPRNVLGGHTMCAIARIISNYFFGQEWWAISVAVLLAAFFMIITKTLHPPGGGTAVVAHMAELGTNPFLVLFPVVVNAIIVIIAALIINNAISSRKYPMFWR
ncbi:MAG: HPP family protein [Syntrophomonadaceae bacterium]|nr:HPP family protein [Syntrophomonadaceae bacterium]